MIESCTLGLGILQLTLFREVRREDAEFARVGCPHILEKLQLASRIIGVSDYE